MKTALSVLFPLTALAQQPGEYGPQGVCPSGVSQAYQAGNTPCVTSSDCIGFSSVDDDKGCCIWPHCICAEISSANQGTQCIGDPGSFPTAAPADPSTAPTNDGGIIQCSLCAGGVQPANAATLLPDGSATCGEISTLVFLFTAEECVQYQEGFFATFCACPGVAPIPTAEPTIEPTPEPTQLFTPTPVSDSTSAPMSDPTAEPTPDPTPDPTAEPTPEPTPVPTPMQTPQPTLDPTPEPTPAFFPGQCSLCDNATSVPNPDIVVDSGKTCAVLEDEFKSYNHDSIECLAARGTYGVYCGCSNPTSDVDACRICDTEFLPNPSRTGDVNHGDSCGFLEYEASWFNQCSEAQKKFGVVCCLLEGQTLSPTAQPTTQEPTPEPTAPPTLDPTPEPTMAKLTIEPTINPTPQSTIPPTPDPTPDPTPEPTPDPIPEPTPDPTPDPTLEPTPDPTPEPTPDPIPEPTPEPTPDPTPDPTPEPTPEPTLDPSAISEPTAMAAPTVEPTPGSTAEPTPEQTPEPTMKETPQPALEPTPQPVPESTSDPTVEEDATPVAPAITTSSPTSYPTPFGYVGDLATSLHPTVSPTTSMPVLSTEAPFAPSPTQVVAGINEQSGVGPLRIAPAAVLVLLTMRLFL